MAETIRIPKYFTCYPAQVAFGFDGKINYAVVEIIKGKRCYSECSAWGVVGKVWWSAINNCWCAEINKKGDYFTSITGEAIEDLIYNIKKFCGWNL